MDEEKKPEITRPPSLRSMQLLGVLGALADTGPKRSDEAVPRGYECVQCGMKDYHVEKCYRPRGYRKLQT